MSEYDSSSSSHSDRLDDAAPRKRRRLSNDSLEGDRQTPLQPMSRIKRTTLQEVPRTEDLASTSQVKVAIDRSADFASIGLDKWLVKSLSNMAITHPTGIQAASIPEILKGRDCIGGSRTGSGKTIAFAAPMLHQWAKDPSGIFAVVLTPTRELALQIFEQYKAISAPVGLKPILVTGGADMRDQALALAKRPHVVIATPGRLADHIRNSGDDTIAGLRRVKYVVFDEADRLLSPGPGSMLPDIDTCLDALPASTKRQLLLFTATITPEVRALTTRPTPAGRPPLFFTEIDTGALAIPATLTQTYQLVNVLHKEKYLHVLLLTPANVKKSVIIFVNRTSTATLLEHMLRLLSHRVTALHSALPHRDRTNNLARFRAGAARTLVATDVAARGLDIPEVGLVVNYDLPRDADDYIHRVGRTARAGRTGVSVSLVGVRDVELVQAIEERVGEKMTEYAEEGVNVETRVVRDALGVVTEKKREAMLAVEEGRDVKGKRVRGARGKFAGR
ncbi:ATP-dependent RNA helicase-like protein dbp8 [Myriangium duriaei CBS 260.36]|uniref:ATP-dependent RNA helicase-like protein dbp8 n=1 Tax=Myriangium duriaei CBS 260.36 TaxID=1168546 RepID=A0A9P4J0D5_9PEZI|nr:ATP-dependent RNA helicase-like protein dbp8 [Myriangium duriaei CBS 260.36]